MVDVWHVGLFFLGLPPPPLYAQKPQRNCTSMNSASPGPNYREDMKCFAVIYLSL